MTLSLFLYRNNISCCVLFCQVPISSRMCCRCSFRSRQGHFHDGRHVANIHEILTIFLAFLLISFDLSCGQVLFRLHHAHAAPSTSKNAPPRACGQQLRCSTFRYIHTYIHIYIHTYMHTYIPSFHTSSFFVTHDLSHTNLSHATLLTSRSFSTSFVFPSFPVPLQHLLLMVHTPTHLTHNTQLTHTQVPCCTRQSFTISFLFPAFPMPSLPFFCCLLEEVDMWGYPVLYVFPAFLLFLIL